MATGSAFLQVSRSALILIHSTVDWTVVSDRCMTYVYRCDLIIAYVMADLGNAEASECDLHWYHRIRWISNTLKNCSAENLSKHVIVNSMPKPFNDMSLRVVLCDLGWGSRSEMAEVDVEYHSNASQSECSFIRRNHTMAEELCSSICWSWRMLDLL